MFVDVLWELQRWLWFTKLFGSYNRSGTRYLVEFNNDSHEIVCDCMGEDIHFSLVPIHCHDHWIDAAKFNPERWPFDEPNPNEVNQIFRLDDMIYFAPNGKLRTIVKGFVSSLAINKMGGLKLAPSV